MHHGFLKLAAAVGLVALIGAGCGGKQEKAPAQPALPSVADQPAAYKTPKGWKTFTTAGYNVTVDYPANWKQEYNAEVALDLLAPDYKESDAGFNVVVEPITTLEPLTDAMVLGIKKDLETQADTVSVDLKKLQTAAGLSYIITAVTRDPEDGVLFHVAQFFTAGDIAGVVATASAKEVAWETHRETFMTMLMNLRFSK